MAETSRLMARLWAIGPMPASGSAASPCAASPWLRQLQCARAAGASCLFSGSHHPAARHLPQGRWRPHLRPVQWQRLHACGPRRDPGPPNAPGASARAPRRCMWPKPCHPAARYLPWGERVSRRPSEKSGRSCFSPAVMRAFSWSVVRERAACVTPRAERYRNR